MRSCVSKSVFNTERRSNSTRRIEKFCRTVQRGFLKLLLSQFNPLYSAKVIVSTHTQTYIEEEMKIRPFSQLLEALEPSFLHLSINKNVIFFFLYRKICKFIMCTYTHVIMSTRLS